MNLAGMPSGAAPANKLRVGDAACEHVQASPGYLLGSFARRAVLDAHKRKDARAVWRIGLAGCAAEIKLLFVSLSLHPEHTSILHRYRGERDVGDARRRGQEKSRNPQLRWAACA